ncbi:MAG: class I SAM-dependent methyltransferase [Thermoplasmata archaeon]|nr:class I SAM-dependent methyltransferase [Thermoplasmata archaeon]
MPLVRGAAKTKRFFDRIAPWYDRINARIYKPEWAARVRSELRGPRVLDVGVGTGFTTGHLVDAIGIDLSAEMHRRARYRGHLVRADFMHPPFRDATFDSIVFAGSFYYLSSAERSAQIASALLRPRGRVVILSPATRLLALAVRIVSRREYRDLLTAAGLTEVHYERLNWAACLVTVRKP